MLSILRRSSAVLGVSLLASLAACSAAQPGTGQGEGEGSTSTSEGILKCGPKQTRECSNEGPGGKQICWCNDAPTPTCTHEHETVVCSGSPSVCACHTSTVCIADTAPVPAELYGCKPGIILPAPDLAELYMCPPTVTRPALAGGRRTRAYYPSTTYSCGPALPDSAFATDCDYVPSTNSCIPVPLTDWYYIATYSGGPIGGGCKGGCEMLKGP